VFTHGEEAPPPAGQTFGEKDEEGASEEEAFSILFL
jgi:hypothetical protein